MQVNVIRYDRSSHQGRDCHPVSAVRNLESEEACKYCAPVRLCGKRADQENNAHQHYQCCEDILNALIASGEQKRERDHAKDQSEHDLGRLVVRSGECRLNTEDRSCQVSGLIGDIADKDRRDYEDGDQDPGSLACKLLSKRFAESHSGDNAQTCSHGLHDDD